MSATREGFGRGGRGYRVVGRVCFQCLGAGKKGNPPSAHFGADLPVDFGSQHAIGLRHKKNEIDVCRG